jgi:hypothetical protein
MVLMVASFPDSCVALADKNETSENRSEKK